MRLEVSREATARTRGAARQDRQSCCRFVEALVAAVFCVETSELTGPGRGRASVAFARQAAMYLAHVNLGLSLTEVGAYFGRDRTTVSHGCARVEDCRASPRYRRVFDCLDAALDRWEESFLSGERRR